VRANDRAVVTEGEEMRTTSRDGIRGRDLPGPRVKKVMRSNRESIAGRVSQFGEQLFLVSYLRVWISYVGTELGIDDLLSCVPQA